MRNLTLTCILAGGVGACATAPVAVPPTQTTAAGSVAEAFDCGMRAVNEMGYVVSDADRSAGFIRVEQERTSFGEALLERVGVYDQLTLTVYPQGNGRTTLRIVPTRVEVQKGGEQAGARVPRAASVRAMEDTRAILGACGAAAS